LIKNRFVSQIYAKDCSTKSLLFKEKTFVYLILSSINLINLITKELAYF